MSEVPTGEVRVAVVLYGGVSLAIYMNGVCEELLRLVRGTSDQPGRLDPVETIYREMSKRIHPEGGRSRVVIDIISGSSAGGINGVALAKALAVGSKDLSVLREAWIDRADVRTLLNDGKRASAKTGLLNGRHMYELLRETLGKMTQDGSTPLTSLLDLFVTTTDLNGRNLRIQLTGKTVSEPVHREVFRFTLDKAADRDDFSKKDAMLAFAARCTSSFPIAFAPMTIQDLPPPLKDEVRTQIKDILGHPVADDRQFADGGYLDNRPFSHAIDLFPLRPPSLPGKRKLLFVDPFPDTDLEGTSTDEAPLRHFDFVENAMLAATVLPRREMIRDDIRSVSEWNRQLTRLGELQKRQEQDAHRFEGDPRLGQEAILQRPRRPEKLEEMDLADLIQQEAGYGVCYATYHHLRVYTATDVLACMIGQMADYEAQSDETIFLRHFIRAWREAHFSTYRQPQLLTETAFLRRFDFDYQRRRLVHLLFRLNKSRAAIDPGDAENLRQAICTALDGLRIVLRPSPGNTESLLGNGDDKALHDKLRSHFGDIMGLATHDERYAAASALYATDESIGPIIDRGMEALGNRVRAQLDTWNANIRTILDEISAHKANPSIEITKLCDAFRIFHWHDVLTFPILEGTAPEEHTEVDVFRISPADSSIDKDPKKLAGSAAGAFGGFLSREWRQNDILWGRLDAADRIVEAMLPEASSKTREDFISRLHNAILAQEFDGQLGRERWCALLKARTNHAKINDPNLLALINRVRSEPASPPPSQLAFKKDHAMLRLQPPATSEFVEWGGRATKILSQMIEAIPPRRGLKPLQDRASTALRIMGVFATRIVALTLPHKLPRSIAERLLGLAIMSGILLTLLAPFLASVSAQVGPIILIVAIVAWLLFYLVAQLLHGSKPTRHVMLTIGLVLVALFAAYGFVTAWGHLEDRFVQVKCLERPTCAWHP